MFYLADWSPEAAKRSRSSSNWSMIKAKVSWFNQLAPSVFWDSLGCLFVEKFCWVKSFEVTKEVRFDQKRNWAMLSDMESLKTLENIRLRTALGER